MNISRTIQEEGLVNFLTRNLGFLVIFGIDMTMNVNFFYNMGGRGSTAWVMPVLGGAFVFLKTWHFLGRINNENSKTKRNFHFVGWLTMAILSIFATISFGMALTNVSTASIEQSNQNASLIEKKTLASIERLEREIDFTLKDTEDRQNANKSYQQAQTEKGEVWTRNINENNTQINNNRSTVEGKQAELRSLLDSLLTKPVEETVRTENQINAIVLFEQIFPKSFVLTAIWIFFFVIGLSIEVTMAMALLPPEKQEEIKQALGLKKPEPTPEPVKPVVKRKPRTPSKPKKKVDAQISPVSEKTPEVNTSTNFEEKTQPTPEIFNNSPISTPTVEQANHVSTEVVIQEPTIVEPTVDTIKEIITQELLLPEEEAFVDEEQIEDGLPVDSKQARASPKLKKQALIHDYIMALYENGTHKYLKDSSKAITDSGIAKIDAQKIFEYLSTYKNDDVPLIEFRKDTKKWYPNFTSQWVLSHLNNVNLFKKTPVPKIQT